MIEYQKYQHVERLGTSETEGILDGEVYVFPKIDGTNGHVWFDGENVRFGSRRRELSLESDNAGFMNAMCQDEGILAMAVYCECMDIFGEWLVPHTLKTYSENAWRKFYIFDIYDKRDGRHLHYNELRVTCEMFGCIYIPPICVLKNPSDDMIYQCLEKNQFLVKDGEGIGEGIVLKNYNYRNKYGRQTWAKVVTNEFKASHVRNDGPPAIGSDFVEECVVSEFLTEDMIKKVYANICCECDGWSSKYIPRLIHTVYHDFVIECIWDVVKKKKSPKIDFKLIQRFCTQKTKEFLNEKGLL